MSKLPALLRRALNVTPVGRLRSSCATLRPRRRYFPKSKLEEGMALLPHPAPGTTGRSVQQGPGQPHCSNQPWCGELRHTPPPDKARIVAGGTAEADPYDPSTPSAAVVEHGNRPDAGRRG